MNGSKLRDLRLASGKTFRQISIESGVTESTVFMIENGQVKNPRIDTLLRLAKALDCQITDFLDDEPEACAKAVV